MYEPSMKQVQEKYELAMKEKMIMRLERDKMSGQLEHLRQSTSLVGSAKTTSGWKSCQVKNKFQIFDLQLESC